jgi:hypothetical protein
MMRKYELLHFVDIDRLMKPFFAHKIFHLLLAKLLLCNAREERPSCDYSIVAYLAACCITIKPDIIPLRHFTDSVVPTL